MAVAKCLDQEIGPLSRKKCNYAPPVANSWLRHCLNYNVFFSFIVCYCHFIRVYDMSVALPLVCYFQMNILVLAQFGPELSDVIVVRLLSQFRDVIVVL